MNLRIKRVLILAFCFLAVCGLAYAETIAYLLTIWMSDEEYSHGFLVVPVAIWILWNRRNEMPAPKPEWSWGAISLLSLAGVIRIVAARFYLVELDAWSIPLTVFGGVWLIAGKSMLRWAAPAIIFLWMMTRIPATLELTLSFPLQQLAAWLSTYSLQLLGYDAVVNGTIIELPNGPVNVQEACSGLKMFMGTLTVAVAFVLLTRRRMMASILIVVSSVPIALVCNVARITWTGMLYEVSTQATLRTIAHDAAGLITLVMSLVMLVAVVLLFEKLIVKNVQAGNRLWIPAVLAVCSMAVYGIIVAHEMQLQRLTEKHLESARLAEKSRDWKAAERLLLRADRLGSDPQLQKRIAKIYLADEDWLKSDSRFRFLLQTAKGNLEDIALVNRVAQLGAFHGLHQHVYELTSLAIEKQRNPHLQPNDESQGEYESLYSMHVIALKAILDRAEDQSSPTTWLDLRQGYQKAINEHPNVSHFYHQLALLLRSQRFGTLQDQRDADELLDQMVRINSTDAAAWTARFDYRIRFPEADINRHGDPERDLQEAVRLAESSGEFPSSLLTILANRALESHDFEAAQKYTQRLLIEFPTLAAGYLLQSQLLDAKGDVELAIEALQTGLRNGGSQVEVSLALWHLLVNSGKNEQAKQVLEQLKARFRQQSVSPFLITAMAAKVQAADLIRKGREDHALEVLHAVFQRRQEYQSSHQPGTDRILAAIWNELSVIASAALIPDLANAARREAIQLDPAQRKNQVRTRVVSQLDKALRDHAVELEQTNDATAWKNLARQILKRNSLESELNVDWRTFRTALKKARETSPENDRECDQLELAFLAAVDDRSGLLEKIRSSLHPHWTAIEIAKQTIQQDRRFAVKIMKLVPRSIPDQKDELDEAGFEILNRVLFSVYQSNLRSDWQSLAERWVLGPKTAGSFANIVSQRLSWLDTDLEAKLHAQFRNHPDDTFLKFGLANVQFERRNYEEAKQEFESILQQTPANVAVINNLVLCLMELQDYALAKKFLQRGKLVAPQDVTLTYVAALLDLHQKRFENAEATLQSIRDRLEYAPKLDLHLAIALYHSGRLREARNHLARAMESIEIQSLQLTRWEETQLTNLRNASFQ